MRTTAVTRTAGHTGTAGTAGAAAATIVYVGNAESQDITVLELRAGGDLSAVATVAVPGPAKSGMSLPMAVAPDKKFLYVALRNEPYAAATFSIDATSGMLTYVGSAPLADSMAYIATDRTGRFLLGASYGGNKVTVNPIGPDGRIGPLRQTITDIPKAHCILADAANRAVLFTSLGGDRIHQRRFDAARGTLSPNDPEARMGRAQAGPRHLVFSPDARFAYVLNELDASVSVFPYDARTGTLGAEAQSAPTVPAGFAGKPAAADVHLTGDGRFLYASERATSTLTAFRVSSDTGRLTSIGVYPTVKQPRAFAIDPSDRYLLAVGQLSHSLIRYTIDGATGKLAEPREYPVGRNPNWVEIVRLV